MEENKFFLLFILFLVFVNSISPNNLALANILERRLFFDGFEIDLSNWNIIATPPNSVEIYDGIVHSGQKSLKINYVDKNSHVALIKRFDSRTNIVLRGWFYDDMSPTKGTILCLKDNLTKDSPHTCLGVVTIHSPNYVLRHNTFSSTYDTGIKRSQGWHLFEIIVTPSGTYAKLDNIFLGKWKNLLQTKADSLEVWSTWGLTGTNIFDDIDILAPNNNIEKEALSLLDKYLSLYRDTDFSPLYSKLGLNDSSEGRFHGNDIRSILDLAYVLTIDWKVKGNQNSLNRAVQLVEDMVNYGKWNNIDRWSVALPASRLIRTSSVVWDFLSPDTKEKILLIVESLGNEFLNRQPDTGYVNDTKAENNAWNAAFLATLAQFYNSHINSQKWEDKGKCFAWHSITTSKDGIYCGVKTQTVYDDFQLDNHNKHPNPVYMAATIHLLGEGAFAYKILNKPIPSEFKHNVSQLYRKLLEYVTDSYHYQVNNQPFSDWSGVIDSFFAFGGGLMSDFIISENLGNYPSKQEIITRRSIFYPEILAELVEKPISSINDANQSNKNGDFYKFFLNSVITESLSMSYFWNHPQQSFRSLKWQVQKDGITWQPLVWSGGPIIEYTIENEEPIFFLYSSQLSNGEIYSNLIPVEPNKTYVVSYKVKTENLNGSGKYPAAIIVSEYNDNAKESDSVQDNRIKAVANENIPKFLGTNGWQEVKYEFTASSQTSFIRLRMLNAGWGVSTGKVWFSHIKISSKETNCSPYLVSNSKKFSSIDIKVGTSSSGITDNKLSVPRGSKIYLKWSGKADTCYALGKWSGLKYPNGWTSYTLYSTGKYIYALLCVTLPQDTKLYNLENIASFDYVEIDSY